MAKNRFSKNLLLFSFVLKKGLIFNFTQNLTKNYYPVFLSFLYNRVYELKIIIFLLSMTLEKARKLLGKEAENWSDDQISAVLKLARGYALACYQKVENGIGAHGIEFIKNKQYLGGVPNVESSNFS